MSRQIVQRIFKLFLFATAIQIAAAAVTMEHIQASYEQLNEKLTDIQKKLDLVTESLKKLDDQQKETAAFLQILERDQKKSVHMLERYQSETRESFQILGHQGRETREALKKLEDHQNETAASPQILERHHNESTPLPSSCVEVFKGAHQGSGVYEIDLSKSDLGPFEVYCLEDPQGGLPWTVVQRRVDGSTDFNRYWADYKRGFGNLSTNFFIGLDKLHELTSHYGPQELWVKLTENVTAHAFYDLFAIGNDDEKYAMNTLGDYSGDAGDSLRIHKGMKFSTRDSDNDKWSAGNCAQTRKGAWWYEHCQYSNLNGVYGSTEYFEGVNWLNFGGPWVSMKYAHMAIRPAHK